MPGINYNELDQMFQVYAICTTVIFFKYIFSQVYGANFNNHPKEDTDKFGEMPVAEDIKRRERTFANDMENIPFDMGIFWAAFVLQSFAIISRNTGMETLTITVLIIIYTGSRVIYTICYVCALQPYRTIAWILARLAVVITACVMISSAFKVNFQVILPAI